VVDWWLEKKTPRRKLYRGGEVDKNVKPTYHTNEFIRVSLDVMP
jgi:hypothetical protein